jgi:thiol-disulfide isomerase/thioredoxin
MFEDTPTQSRGRGTQKKTLSFKRRGGGKQFMTTRFARSLFYVSVLTFAGCSSATAAKDEIVTLSIKVVDEAGKPVEGIAVGARLSRAQTRAEGNAIKDTGWTVAKFDRDLTGQDGIVRFRTGLRQVTQGPFMHAVAWHADRRLLGVTVPEIAWREKPGELVLKPACLVKLHLTCPELESRHRPLKSAEIGARWAGEDPFKYVSWMELTRLDGRFEFPALPGAIQLNIRADGTEGRNFDFTVPKGQTQFDAGPIELTATRVALLEGQSAPDFHDIVAWVNSQPLQLAPLKGKVVVLDFWGHWCGACVMYGIPELLELHDKYHDQGLVVIGVHVSRGGPVIDTAEKLEEKTAQTRTQFWKGRNLPFPVALAVGKQGLIHAFDKDPAIATDYGVKTYPTDILIDRQGKVVASSVGYPISERFKESLKKALSER